jgi:hypothetical protein
MVEARRQIAFIRLEAPRHASVECYGVSSTVSLWDHPDDRNWTYQTVFVSPEQAHELAEAPIVSTRAISKRATPDGWMEVAWELCAVGFIEAEAHQALGTAVAELFASFTGRP